MSRPVYGLDLSLTGTAIAKILASVHSTGQAGPKKPATGARFMSVPARPPEGH